MLAVGKGKIKEDGAVLPLDVKADDRVLFAKYAGTEITINGKLYLIMREEEVFGLPAKSSKRVRKPLEAMASIRHQRKQRSTWQREKLSPVNSRGRQSCRA